MIIMYSTQRKVAERLLLKILMLDNEVCTKMERESSAFVMHLS